MKNKKGVAYEGPVLFVTIVVIAIFLISFIFLSDALKRIWGIEGVVTESETEAGLGSFYVYTKHSFPVVLEKRVSFFEEINLGAKVNEE